ncbi:MAG: DUF2442 domain-containing protein [Paludibacter sp.]|nr:DUF2442 domain-containing protein [Paludibacter sp.]
MTREDLKRLWFSADRIFIETKEGAVKSMPLEWFPRLKNATPAEKEDYELSAMGIHWETIDEDLSFEGFFTYNKQQADKQRNTIQELVKAFPMINLSELATRVGISPAVMRHYACNVKRPSAARKKEIEQTLHRLGEELLHVEL